ncbi:MAG: dihydroneopterin aldolase [Sphingomonadaceae bacterium]|uniref:dihydroneopterin aldolase n=1 Tax=Thermaurantiacus sp. TaxID=2820283 RepID=UPI00298F2568|nr:dihydroneopterin aldolase [Thermaurantiacus sp.]MCS6986789.1 dihydroneopterin aldolase [Sphingomonadaceae bacterium]MDW8413948.1 dihydroneopterin aldolase [Thermaurantiacus sp.]
MSLAPTGQRILLENLSLDVDIGFHDFEVGVPQRVLVTVEVELMERAFPAEDRPEAAWDYDRVRDGIQALVRGRRFNLQETLAREIFAMVAALPGVKALTVVTRKPDVYPDAGAVGVVLSGRAG